MLGIKLTNKRIKWIISCITISIILASPDFSVTTILQRVPTRRPFRQAKTLIPCSPNAKYIIHKTTQVSWWQPSTMRWSHLILPRVVLKHYPQALRLTLKQTCSYHPQHLPPPVLDLKIHLTSTHCQNPARTESRQSASR